MGKGEEYRKKLEERKAKRAAEAKKFDIAKFLESAGETREKYVEAIKSVIAYGPLTLKDSIDIMKHEDTQERAIVILWKMLQKADSKITLEQVEALPLDVATAILTEIGAGFFLTQTPTVLKAGSEETRKPSYTA